MLTFRQQCVNCAEQQELSRAHAFDCTGEGDRLACALPKYYAEYTRSRPEADGILFAEYVANRMDKMYQNTKMEAIKIFQHLNQAVVAIRDKASGFVASTDNRSFYYPPRHSDQRGGENGGARGQRRLQASILPARAPGRYIKSRRLEPG